MSLLKAIFGAKPTTQTPPFAPPHDNTGGSNPIPAPGQPQHGIAGFLERALNPQNALGQFGMALTAAGGNLGDAMAVLMQQHALAGKQGAEFNDWQQKYDYELAHPKPHDPTGFAAELTAAGIDPNSEQGRKMLLEHANNALDPWVNISVPDAGTYYGPRSGIPKSLAPPAGVTFTPLDGPATAPPAGGTAPKADYGAVKNAIVDQETRHRYGLVNPTSGAMGIGQQMPGTARVLAGRLGLPWRPNLMTGTDPQAQSYQDAVTEAAVREAYNAAHGDPAATANYYYGGSTRAKGPRTRAYSSSILRRLGG